LRSVTYSMSVSLDGYIVGPDGDFDWTAPDEEVFRFATDEVRQVGVHVLGRRLYETMLYWETADQDPSLDDSRLEPLRRPCRRRGGCPTLAPCT
jgi:dihydrofolate reductase